MRKNNLLTTSAKDAAKVLKKGNVFMLAIGLLLGTVFNAVVASFANDILMNAIKTHFMPNGTLDTWEVSGMLLGKFLGTLIQFAIVTIFLFVVLVGYFMISNAYKAHKAKNQPVVEPAPAAPTTEQLILEELKNLNKNLENK
ncbi:hypothetical protein VO56_00345 [Mycoplasmopsis gallinacea]|uniref:Large conductance mechanosensitive channel protein MscL n=1 Tax=Mycoplasmopsis gallinacea TaxID=29556 RepID=A0A0D5ZJA2_9BACT|nr:hypothetical protein VO56_00345 [Mycoplasmopsis gallinacea]